jgi:hypothetical protein
MITTTYYDEYNQELKPGLKSLHQHALTTPKFSIYGILDSLNPERWRAEVRLFDSVIITMEEQHSTKEAAGRAAEAALQVRLLEVFGTRS